MERDSLNNMSTQTPAPEVIDLDDDDLEDDPIAASNVLCKALVTAKHNLGAFQAHFVDDEDEALHIVGCLLMDLPFGRIATVLNLDPAVMRHKYGDDLTRVSDYIKSRVIVTFLKKAMDGHPQLLAKAVDQMINLKSKPTAAPRVTMTLPLLTREEWLERYGNKD